MSYAYRKAFATMGLGTSRPLGTLNDTAVLQSSWKRILEGTPAFDTWLATSISTPDSLSDKTHGPKSAGRGPLTFFNDTFYQQFFELVPGAVLLFNSQIHQQARLLGYFMQQLLSAKQGPDSAAGVVAHNHFHSLLGLEAWMYVKLGDSILYAVKACLGAEYTPSVAAAWSATVARMVSVLQPAARSAERRLVLARCRKACLGACGCTGAAATVAVAPASPSLPRLQSMRQLRSVPSRASFVTEDSNPSYIVAGQGTAGQGTAAVAGQTLATAGKEGMARGDSEQSCSTDPAISQSVSLSPRAQARASSWQDVRPSLPDRGQPGNSTGPAAPQRKLRMNSIDGTVVTEDVRMRRSQSIGQYDWRGSLPSDVTRPSPRVSPKLGPEPSPRVDEHVQPLSLNKASGSPGLQPGPIPVQTNRDNAPAPSRPAWTADAGPKATEGYSTGAQQPGSPGPANMLHARTMASQGSVSLARGLTGDVERVGGDVASVGLGLGTVPEEHDAEKSNSGSAVSF